MWYLCLINGLFGHLLSMEFISNGFAGLILSLVCFLLFVFQWLLFFYSFFLLLDDGRIKTREHWPLEHPVLLSQGENHHFYFLYKGDYWQWQNQRCLSEVTWPWRWHHGMCSELDLGNVSEITLNLLKKSHDLLAHLQLKFLVASLCLITWRNQYLFSTQLTFPCPIQGYRTQVQSCWGFTQHVGANHSGMNLQYPGIGIVTS